MRRERAGMRRANHAMARRLVQLRNPRRFLLRMAAPQDEHRRLFARRHRRDAGVGNRVPPAPRMAARIARLDRQRVVEQQHAALCPRGQVARRGRRDTAIIRQFPEDVSQRGRMRHAIGDREAQPHRLPRAMVGVLPQNHDLDLVQRGQLQRAQAAALRRIDRLARSFLGAQKAAQLARLRRGEHRGQRVLPAIG